MKRIERILLYVTIGIAFFATLAILLDLIMTGFKISELMIAVLGWFLLVLYIWGVE